jgi:hypothetical protein
MSNAYEQTVSLGSAEYQLARCGELECTNYQKIIEQWKAAKNAFGKFSMIGSQTFNPFSVWDNCDYCTKKHPCDGCSKIKVIENTGPLPMSNLLKQFTAFDNTKYTTTTLKAGTLQLSYGWGKYVEKPRYKDFDIRLIFADEAVRVINTITQWFDFEGSDEEHKAAISCLLEREAGKRDIQFNTSFVSIHCCEGNLSIVNKVANISNGNLEGIYDTPEWITTYEGKKENKYLTPDTVKSICCQLIGSLMFMDEYYMCHGEPSLKYLSFTSSSIPYVYRNRIFKSNTGLIINPSRYSSVTYMTQTRESVRIYHGNDTDVDLALLKQYSKRRFISIDGKERVGVCIEGYKKTYIEVVRNLGLPLLRRVIDLYFFFVSLAFEEVFYGAIVSHPKCVLLWKSLWSNDEYDKLTKKIKEYHRLKRVSPASFDEIFEFLSEFTLSNGSLQVLWGLLESQNMCPLASHTTY